MFSFVLPQMISLIPQKLISAAKFNNVFGSDHYCDRYRQELIPKKILSRIVRILFVEHVDTQATLNGQDGVDGSAIEQSYGESAFQALIG